MLTVIQACGGCLNAMHVADKQATAPKNDMQMPSALLHAAMELMQNVICIKLPAALTT